MPVLRQTRAVAARAEVGERAVDLVGTGAGGHCRGESLGRAVGGPALRGEVFLAFLLGPLRENRALPRGDVVGIRVHLLLVVRAPGLGIILRVRLDAADDEFREGVVG